MSSQELVGDEDYSYKQVSALAVTSFVISLLGPASIVGAAAWGIPLLAMVLAVLALVYIAREEGRLTGRWLAVTALFLGVVFLFAGPTAQYFTGELLVNQAKAFADGWMRGLEQGELEVAHMYMLDIGYRTANLEPSEVKAFILEKDARVEAFNAMKQGKEMKMLIAAAPQKKVRYEGPALCQIAKKNANVELLYSVYDEGEGKERKLLVKLKKSRVVSDQLSSWQVNGVEILPFTK